MRYVFYFVALLSAFFSYAAYDPELGYDPDDLKSPRVETETVLTCTIRYSDFRHETVTRENCESLAMGFVTQEMQRLMVNQCSEFFSVEKSGEWTATLGYIDLYRGKWNPEQASCEEDTTFRYNIRMSDHEDIVTKSCPPEQFPEYYIEVVVGQLAGGESDIRCSKPYTPENPDSCPAQHEDSLSLINFTLNDVSHVCFDNPNGDGQCSYEVDNFMYRTPPELGSSEPVNCATNEPVDPDNIQPNDDYCYETTNGAYCNANPDDKCSVVTDTLTGDTYTKCEPNCGYINGDFFCVESSDKPVVPSECMDPDYQATHPEECKSNQDTDKDGDGQVDNTDVVEAINQLASQGDDRANTLNKLLGEAIDGNGLAKEGNKLLKKISDKLDKEDQNEQPFTTTTERKGQGPLDSLFNDAWTAETEASIESLKSDIGNFRQQIQSDMDSIFSLSSFSGSYSQIKHQIFGVDTDFSMSRFQELFQALAAAFMFVAVIYAVYILLS
ncbi:hypothetical protein [Pseudoalteromonas ruthenica]|uniref:hypothetical protein n=1 Tax=Pseudoalteromonas ruthenica TaxID=151081 RepID=UPI0012456A64|nr:hypothetical protein [Pseudoalteromonas ruthenica]